MSATLNWRLKHCSCETYFSFLMYEVDGCSPSSSVHSAILKISEENVLSVLKITNLENPYMPYAYKIDIPYPQNILIWLKFIKIINKD